MAAWTGGNPTAPRGDNPHSRENVYSPEDFARAALFNEWAKANPGEPPAKNPHRHGDVA
jgi:hypothetical protein